LADKIHKLKKAFESLETFFFRRSVEKAFQLDEPSSQNVPTTSVIDDVMFVLKKVLDRAMGTGDVELLKTICANTRRILELDFAGAIKRRVNMDSQRLVRDDYARRERFRGFLAELNNLAISSENVTGLAEGYLQTNLEGLFPFEDQLPIAKNALMSIGNLKERFDGYLHVLWFVKKLIVGGISEPFCTGYETCYKKIGP
jgi:conserved oligomeric Golgi complex subunit 4